MYTYLKTRTVIYILVVLLFLSGCQKQGPELRKTAVAAGVSVLSDPDEAAALMMLSTLPAIGPGQVYGTQAGTSLWAIQQAINQAPGTFIMLKDSVAIFVSPAAREGGMTYYFYGFVDISTNGLADLCKQLNICGNMTSVSTMQELKAFLESKGFVETLPADIPVTIQVLRAGLRCLTKVVRGIPSAIAAGGQTAIEIIAVPAWTLGNNPVIPPWCVECPQN